MIYCPSVSLSLPALPPVVLRHYTLAQTLSLPLSDALCPKTVVAGHWHDQGAITMAPSVDALHWNWAPKLFFFLFCSLILPRLPNSLPVQGRKVRRERSKEWRWRHDCRSLTSHWPRLSSAPQPNRMHNLPRWSWQFARHQDCRLIVQPFGAQLLLFLNWNLFGCVLLPFLT